MVTRHQRTGRQARTLICSLLVAASACWLLPVANASAAPDFTWSGAAPLGTPNWSNTLNWGGTAPSGSVGTLGFPALTSPACTAEPPTATCYQSNNDVSGLNVNAISIDNKVGYHISGNPITLGAGGITASPSDTGGNVAELGIPITLGASQTWSITDSTGGQGLEVGANVSGAASTLAISFFGIFAILNLNADAEVGAVNMTGHGTVLLGRSHPGSLNGTDGNPVSLSKGASITSSKGAIGPLTLVESLIGLRGAGTLAVDGSVTFGTESGLGASITHPGTVAGTDYSQLSASGTVSIVDAFFSLSDGEAFVEGTSQCELLTPGDVDTLVTTTGSLTGTFNGVPDGSTMPLGCSAAGTPPTVKINYSAHEMTATVETAGSTPKEEAARKQHEEEAAKKHQEEEAAAKKHQEEEAAAKKHQEEAAAKLAKEIEEFLAKIQKEIEKLFRLQLTPSGPSAQIGTLLKSGVFSTSFKALQAGTAVINWYQVPPGAKLATKAKPKPVLVASGRRSFSAAGTAKIKIKLTAAGKRLLKHAKKLKLTAKGTFTPTGKTPITATKVFVLKRR